ncbi:hypothetical protein MUP05_07630 [Candidatus Bathyarchaeota archaeon]|nr:hypothetical protein [Candidatus Bathyarchaeota archaeon]
MEWPLFPYEPYPQQLEFMRDVKNVVGNHGILVAEACNGFGKTVSALASILPMGHRIVYATRTHEQVHQVLLEVERINQCSGSSFSAVNLASRQHLCLNDKCRQLSNAEALEVCRMLRKADECPYKTEILQLPPLPSVLSTTKLQTEGRNREICPYFLARKVAENCTVTVAPYQYVFNEEIRSQVKLVLTDKILIFDEAHNADQIGQEVLSDTLSDRTLSNAKKELEAMEVSSEFIDEITVFLDRKVSGKVAAEPGFKLHEGLKETLKVELVSFIDSLSDIVEKIRQYKVERGEHPVCYLNGVLSFFSLVESSPRSCYVTIYKRFYDLNLIEYRCLDPSLAMKPLVHGARGALIMSGTLSPMELFTEILGLEKAETRTYSAVAKPENVRVVVDPSVTTRFTERSDEMIQRIGERFSKLVAKIPNGVLIFFPQRKFMLDALDAWMKTGLIKGTISCPYLDEKQVFVEGARAEENRKIVEEYKRSAKTGNGAVLCGVFRGRNAEGSNFPYEEARGVVLIGVPYADYSDPVVKAQIEYFNRKRKDLGDKWYVMDAFRAANQALGRGIRHRDDWCNFILMDYRYKTHQELISNWIVVNGILEIPT